MRIRHINYEWLTWGVTQVPHGDLPQDVRARIDADRRRASALRVVTRTMPIAWVEDRSVRARFIGHWRRLRDESRRFAELTFNEHYVYLEAIGGNGGGPGFGFRDVRIYLGGQIVGRAWWLGCSLGGGGRVEPAVAMLRADLALRVDLTAENLELVRLTEPGTIKRAHVTSRRRPGRKPRDR